MHAAIPTATTVLDSILFRDAFGTPRMREIFSDYALISRYAEVEIALAKGKREYDKRHALRERQDRREAERAMRRYVKQARR